MTGNLNFKYSIHIHPEYIVDSIWFFSSSIVSLLLGNRNAYRVQSEIAVDFSIQILLLDDILTEKDPFHPIVII